MVRGMRIHGFKNSTSEDPKRTVSYGAHLFSEEGTANLTVWDKNSRNSDLQQLEYYHIR